MSELVCTATCRAFGAVVEGSGEVVAEPVLAERAGWLAALVRRLAARVVAERWNRADLDLLGSGAGLDGRALPAKGWMAIRRLGWGVSAPDGVYVSDRGAAVCGGGGGAGVAAGVASPGGAGGDRRDLAG